MKGPDPEPSILAIRALTVRFGPPRRFALGRSARLAAGAFTALDGIDLRVPRGGILGLVGESGSGKSTAARAILRLLRTDAGEILFDRSREGAPSWVDLARLGGEALRRIRRDVQMVFQDPYSSLDPRQTVGSIIAEPLWIFRAGSARHIRARVEALLAEVGLDPWALRRYPHEFSGGQRQRIGIARALAPDPRLLVCDEPVSALDVSIQGQIVNLLLEQQERRGLSMLFISHDLSLVRRIASRLSVIYRGRIVEEGPSESVFAAPAHPYTRALLEAASIPAGAEDACRLPGSGSVDAIQSSGWRGGCAFAPRCGFVEDRCRREAPGLEALSGRPEHRAACFLIAES